MSTSFPWAWRWASSRPSGATGTCGPSLGLEDGQPLLIYVGRLDGEKKPQVVADAFRRLPVSLGARLALIGEGPMRDEIAALGDSRIVMPGYLKDRAELAGWLASADIYVSAMADETFGVSIIEAQASGLPVVGVAAGAMLDRVSEETGRLGPVGDSAAMASNILDVWNGERPRNGRAGSGACAPVQLGAQHGRSVRPRLPGCAGPPRRARAGGAGDVRERRW